MQDAGRRLTADRCPPSSEAVMPALSRIQVNSHPNSLSSSPHAQIGIIARWLS